LVAAAILRAGGQELGPSVSVIEAELLLREIEKNVF